MNSEVQIPDLNVVLLHDDMLNKEGKRVTTSLTMIDTHDIARSSRSFGVTDFFVAHSSSSLRRMARTLKSHWDVGHGAIYNPKRKDALSIAQIVSSLEEAISLIDARTNGILPKLIATSAARSDKRISHIEMREIINQNPKQPYLIMFGTGWGMVDELIERADYYLEPVEGPGSYNHLSVRSACAIILDRLMGKH